MPSQLRSGHVGLILCYFVAFEAISTYREQHAHWPPLRCFSPVPPIPLTDLLFRNTESFVLLVYSLILSKIDQIEISFAGVYHPFRHKQVDRCISLNSYLNFTYSAIKATSYSFIR